ncbi:hypothetical protein [Anaerovorax odorimutans]|nr:hypothetical protein [Anaerovorax odorimutans]
MKDEILERNLRFAEANMEFEGFEIDGRLREMGRRILSGECSADAIVSSCLSRYGGDAE